MSESTLTVTIEKLVQGGKGLARNGSQVLFVRGAIPAETVAVTGGLQHKGYQEATVSGVLVASPDRVTPPCTVYEVCGGCQLQHIRYEAQLVQKREILKETLMRVGRLDVGDILQVVASSDPYGYRNAVRFVVFSDGKGFALGFHQQGTNRPVAAAGCLLIPQAMRDTAAALNERLANLKKLPFRVEAVEIRRSMAFGSVLLRWRTLQAKQKQAQELIERFQDVPDVVGQVVMDKKGRRWINRQDWIADRSDDLLFRISDRSIAQANWVLNKALSHTVAEWLGPVQRLRVLELYSGIGTLGLPLARRGALVTEVEANPYALADARHVAKTNHIGRCRFRPLRAEAMLQTVQAGDYDVVIVSPPRTGLSQECLQGLARISMGRLLYLSCDPAILARDLGRLCGDGYRITRIQPFDMFPQTAHLETLVELVR